MKFIQTRCQTLTLLWKANGIWGSKIKRKNLSIKSLKSHRMNSFSRIYSVAIPTKKLQYRRFQMKVNSIFRTSSKLLKDSSQAKDFTKGTSSLMELKLRKTLRLSYIKRLEIQGSVSFIHTRLEVMERMTLDLLLLKAPLKLIRRPFKSVRLPKT